jgi:hypothetical protein
MFPQKQLVNTVLLVSSHNIKLDACDLRGNNCAIIVVSDDFAGRLNGFEDPKFLHSSMLLL